MAGAARNVIISAWTGARVVALHYCSIRHRSSRQYLTVRTQHWKHWRRLRRVRAAVANRGRMCHG